MAGCVATNKFDFLTQATRKLEVVLELNLQLFSNSPKRSVIAYLHPFTFAVSSSFLFNNWSFVLWKSPLSYSGWLIVFDFFAGRGTDHQNLCGLSCLLFPCWGGRITQWFRSSHYLGKSWSFPQFFFWAEKLLSIWWSEKEMKMRQQDTRLIGLLNYNPFNHLIMNRASD